MVKARYEQGVFIPLAEVHLQEECIVEVSVPEAPLRRMRLRELGFVGMWADRTDIPDGITYVDRLRG